LNGQHLCEPRSVAYDAYWIRVSPKFQSIGRDDPIIHECVHFLQPNTHEEDAAYIQFDPTGPMPQAYLAYATQRAELGPHLVQIAYILENETHHASECLTAEKQRDVEHSIGKFVETRNTIHAIEAILRCKEAKLV
jgi:hypothetical protein